MVSMMKGMRVAVVAGAMWYSGVGVLMDADDDKANGGHSHAIAKFIENHDATEVQAGLKLMAKMIGNIIDHPTDKKYRIIKKSSEGLRSKILRLRGGADVITEMGFKEHEHAFVNEFQISVLTKYKNQIDEAIAHVEATSQLTIGSDVKLVGLRTEEMNGLSGTITQGPVFSKGVERYVVAIQANPQVLKLSEAMQCKVRGSKKLTFKKENMQLLDRPSEIFLSSDEKCSEVRGAATKSVLGSVASSESSAPPMCQPLPSGKLMNVRDGVSDISSESSAPPMCQPLPSGKLMNVGDWVSDISSESSAPPMCQPLPSGKLMNVRDKVSDISSDPSDPSAKGKNKEITDEYPEKTDLSDVTSQASSDVASFFTSNTKRQMKKIVSDDLNNIDISAGYEGESLVIAAELRDAVAVQRILNLSSVDVNVVDEHDRTALYIASEYGDAVIVKKLLANEHTNVNRLYTSVNEQVSALVLACAGNHIEVFRLLLDHRDIDHSHVQYCLFQACSLQHLEIVKHVLEHPRIDVDSSNALSAACMTGSLELVEMLLERNEIDVNTVKNNGGGATPLFMACEFGHLEIVEKLLERTEIELNKTTANHGATPFCMACGKGHLEVVERLLERNEIEVNKGTTTNGTTPLYIACEGGHLEIAEKLLKRKEIEVNQATTDEGSTPLFIACGLGHLEIVEKLLERTEIEVNKAKIDNGNTPLYIACGTGYFAIVKKLLDRKDIEVNKATPDDCTTPLYVACEQGHLEIVEKLLQRNEIEVRKATTDGVTPFLVACKNGHLEIVEQLLERNEIEVNKATYKYGSPLYMACGQGHLEIVEKLLGQNEIEVNKAKIDNGNTPPA